MKPSSPSEPNAEAEVRPKSFLQKFIEEPLLHFLLLAACLFVVHSLIGIEDKDLIVVDAEAQKYLFKQEQDLRLRPLTDEEKKRIIENYIEEEILVREAKARGFTDSSRIRALLIQNMRFFLSSDVPEPAEDDLRAHFEANKDDFTSPPSLNLNHVMFKDSVSVPEDILQALDEAEDPSKIGEFDTQLGYDIRFLDQRRLVGLFGADTAKELLSVPKGDKSWHGPIEAPNGSVHFLRVTAHNPPRTPDFETARDWVSTHWLSSKSRALIDASLTDMRENYQVEVQLVEGS